MNKQINVVVGGARWWFPGTSLPSNHSHKGDVPDGDAEACEARPVGWEGQLPLCSAPFTEGHPWAAKAPCDMGRWCYLARNHPDSLKASSM